MMNTGKIWTFVTSLMLWVGVMNGQEKGMLVGRVTDTETGDPLFAVCVLVENTILGAETDYEGYYWIDNIPPGQYDVTAIRIGYTTVNNFGIEIASSLTTELDINMLSNPVYAREEVTVTATRGNALVSEVPASVDIIDAAVIEMQKPQNLAEVMQNVQGVNIKDYGGIGGIKSVSVRGSSSGQVLVMLDGQRLNDAASGQVDFSRISVEGVEKIEVVRGGGSALYGADAIGGVINIITRKEIARNRTSGSIDLMTGSFTTTSAKADLRRSGEQYAASVTYKVLQTEGNFPYPDPNLDILVKKRNNDFTANDLFTNFQCTLGDKPLEHTIDVSYNHYTNDKGSPGSTTQPYDSARTTNQTHRVNLTAQGKLNLFNNYRFQTFLNNATNTYFNNEMTVAADDTHKTSSSCLELQMTTVLSANQKLIYGAGTRFDRNGGPGSTDETNKRSAIYAFLQGEFIFHMIGSSPHHTISLVPALRFDGYSDFGNHWSPKLGMVFNFGTQWRTSVKANLGYNYKAPSFNDLYWPEDAFTVGNQDLKPEHGTDWDVGLRLRYPIVNGIAFDVTYFRMQLTDLIVWQQGGSGGKWSPMNVSRALNQGVEAALNLKLVPDFLSLALNYTYLLAQNDDADDRNYYRKYLVYRPKNTLNVTMDASWQAFTAGLSWQYVGYRYVLPANTIWLDPYHVASLTLGRRYAWEAWNLDVTLQVKNLFDEHYEFIQYQPIPGREYRINVGIGGNLSK